MLVRGEFPERLYSCDILQPPSVHPSPGAAQAITLLIRIVRIVLWRECMVVNCCNDGLDPPPNAIVGCCNRRGFRNAHGAATIPRPGDVTAGGAREAEPKRLAAR